MAGGDVTPLLAVKTPVPSDIDIAQAIAPLHISAIAEKLGILPEELEPYGTHKAKVRARWPLTRPTQQLDRGRGAPQRPRRGAIHISRIDTRRAALQVQLSVRDRLKDAPSGKYGEQRQRRQRSPHPVPRPDWEPLR